MRPLRMLAAGLALLSLSACVVVPAYEAPAPRAYYYHPYYYHHDRDRW